MSVSSVNSTSYTTAGTASSRDTSTSLDKEDFLNLLVTQLKYQDPLNPSDSTEYVSQLAQFSLLEQMTNMNTSLEALEALTMTGKYITASVTGSSGETTTVEGTVDSVTMSNGEAALVVGGKSIELSDVCAVYDYDRSSLYSLSAMIGKSCEGYIYNAETLDVINVAGTIAGVVKGSYEDYALVDGVQCTLGSITSEDYRSADDEADYLNEHLGEEISATVVDSDGKEVEISGVLESATEEEDGSMTLIMNGVKIPVDGIYSIS
ncbi:flagellar hook capping protein [Syntrophobotulus glycolicus DSM 8271]|uniref:Basal-body rod modification protein FlgD n=1 Tax=Syntrophobotulus glycolicus (strain DSM 8271 / FlGlyR) TaxID=645991 RepID=F0SU29_SYNGF|nr:flagellar hook capping FlgD N-terminal domain-containing protein [Syntrophobotulus glycolicus]ADY55412.1 flagellar hook capping protein [Syntrophobotulus glycolicus DSM 8271]